MNRYTLYNCLWMQMIYKQLFLGLGHSNYFTNLITWGMQIMSMNDTARELDMEILIMKMKKNAACF